MCGIVRHLGALSWMSRLIPVPFDFLSAAAAGLWGREKTGFEGNRQLQLLELARPHNTWLFIQLGSSFVGSPFVNHPRLWSTAGRAQLARSCLK